MGKWLYMQCTKSQMQTQFFTLTKQSSRTQGQNESMVPYFNESILIGNTAIPRV